MKLLEMGRDMKIVPHLPPTESGGTFFSKKLWGTSVFGQIEGEMFYMGTNDQIKQKGRYRLTGFKGQVKLVLSSLTLA